MKKTLSYLLAILLLGSGCSSQRTTMGDPAAIMVGARLGGITGALIGGASAHSPHASGRNSLIGALVGTVVGVAVANAATSTEEELYVDQEQQPAHSVSKNIPTPSPSSLTIRNIRFIDDTRDHVIQSGEQAKIIFEVYNNGHEPIYSITPAVIEKTGVKNLYISPLVTIESISPGEGIRYTATVTAGKLKRNEQEVLFGLIILDEHGKILKEREFTIPLQR